MLVLLCFLHIKPERIEEFKAACVENADHSIQEEGIVRFDLIQQQDDPNRFALLEVYRDVAATLAHKETAHYLKWREAMTDLMAEPRHAIKYEVLHPGDETWG